MKTVAILALLVCSFAISEAAFCRVSSYKIKDPQMVVKNKQSLFIRCSRAIPEVPRFVGAYVVKPDGCVTIRQVVASKENWDKYSACEKTAANADKYAPLKAGSDACIKWQAKEEDCKA